MEPRLTPTPTSFVVNAAALSRADISFISTAESQARKEIAVSRAVMDQLSNPQLKSFAQQVIAEHTLVEADLGALAQLKGVEIASKDESAFPSDWSKRRGDVDHNYVREMVSD
jgi:putative membrane protein